MAHVCFYSLAATLWVLVHFNDGVDQMSV